MVNYLEQYIKNSVNSFNSIRYLCKSFLKYVRVCSGIQGEIQCGKYTMSYKTGVTRENI